MGKTNKKEKMIQKVYKPLNVNSNNMLPGDPKGSPDESFFSGETLIFIDANFLSKLSKHFGKGNYLIYDLIKFSNYLARKQKFNCKDIYYYTAPPFQSPMPTKEEEQKLSLGIESGINLESGKNSLNKSNYNNRDNYSYLTFQSGFDSRDSNMLLISSSGPAYVEPITFPVRVSRIVIPITLKNPPSRSSIPPIFIVTTYLTMNKNKRSDYINVSASLKKGWVELNSVRIEGISRIEKWEIPLEAFREALINAIAHRDYNERGAHIQIDIFENRVEISNPGGLIIKEEEFGKRSLSRNPHWFAKIYGIICYNALKPILQKGYLQMDREYDEKTMNFSANAILNLTDKIEIYIRKESEYPSNRIIVADLFARGYFRGFNCNSLIINKKLKIDDENFKKIFKSSL